MSDWANHLIVRAIFGGNPRDNERRYRANKDLEFLTIATRPWTKEALQSAVRGWLEAAADDD